MTLLITKLILDNPPRIIQLSLILFHFITKTKKFESFESFSYQKMKSEIYFPCPTSG